MIIPIILSHILNIYLCLEITNPLSVVCDHHKVHFGKDSSRFCGHLSVSCRVSFSGVYIIYDLPQRGTLSLGLDTPYYMKIGNQHFLHEYVNIRRCTKHVTIHYEKPAKIKQIFAINGKPADWIERWQPPYSLSDVLLLPTHSDDEHLYFCGLIPTLLNANYSLQVAYTVIHVHEPQRHHELLAGLWAVGIRHYPLFGVVPDSFSTNLSEALVNLNNDNHSLQEVIKYHVDCIRRFRPYIIISHDENGESGHGQHRLTTYSLKRALLMIGKPAGSTSHRPYVPSKVFFHLYPKHTIRMNYDIPLRLYNGMTAYQVSRLGFSKHESQRHLYFTSWLEGPNGSYTKASQIAKNSPLLYGLYFSTVGYSNATNDMFYNISKQPVDQGISITDFREDSFEVCFNNNHYTSMKLWVAIYGSLACFLLWKSLRYGTCWHG